MIVDKMITHAVKEFEHTKSPLKNVGWQPIKTVLVKVIYFIFFKFMCYNAIYVKVATISTE